MPISQYFSTPSELVSLLKMKYLMKVPTIPDEENLKYCYTILITVSRSFAAVIQELPDELRHPVCVFYLVLRALDTIEDDTKFPLDKKIPLLNNFYELMEDETFNVENCGDKDYYRDLLLNYPKVTKVYKSLDEKYRLVIKDITKRMGQGMAEYINTKSVYSLQDYNHYCHYVAGLVGLGLSEMFVKSGLESEELLDLNQSDVYSTISNQMGLFLQKTNIIRDYHEDIVEDRIFWPEQVWSKYAEHLEDFKEEKNIQQAVYCLNELVTETMDLIPACIKYMSLLKNQQIFNFCAIPQVMAIATLAEIYNNPDVFRKNVKIRKGMAAELIQNTKTSADVARTFNYFMNKIEKKIDDKDPNAEVTRAKIQEIKKLTAEHGTLTEGRSFLSYFALASFTAATGYVLYQYRSVIQDKISGVLKK